MNNTELPKTYDPHAVEDAIAKRWEEQGYSNPDNLPKRHTEPFVVMMPPPNVTGSLHMGHALEASMTDCLIRMKRMQGFRTLYLPGTDHASIATQNVVEKELAKEDKTRFDLGREKFLERVWEWKEQYGDIILEQFKRLGASADWSRSRFTMDQGYTKAVEETFLHYHNKGWIYKGIRVVNWCTRCATTLSDLELEHEPKKGNLWYIRYPLKESSTSADTQNPSSGILVATTRPETMLGDTAVAVHPDDERYKNLIGKTVVLPLAKREIPIIADEAVDREFGTGAIKVTPAHDLLDAEIGERHNLAAPNVIDQDGRITDQAPEPYRGLTVKQARERVVEDLKKQGAIEKTEDYEHNVTICYRCGTAIEPVPSEQWFLKMDELAKLAHNAYASGEITVTPDSWERVALERLANEKDWCISRQLWWGHKIPLEGEEDVLDTWFSSALWPFATLGWPGACNAPRESNAKSYAKKREHCIPKEGSDLERYYPSQWMTSGRDILFLWINRMVFSGLEFMGEAPFPAVYLHPTVLTKDGKRMSKSLGTGIDPLELIEKYGADAVRFGLLWQTTGLQDIRFDEDTIVAGKKFLNKLWNATRFALMNAQGVTVPETRPEAANKEDAAFLDAVDRAVSALEEDVTALRFGQALEGFYQFFWHTFCDECLERMKEREDAEAKKLLLWTLSVSLRALHPFLPFITEELWEKLPWDTDTPTPLSIAAWPKK